MMSEVKRR